MANPTYLEFEWYSAGAANGESGEALTQMILGLVKGLSDVRSICDLGCGNGYLANQLAALGYEVVGVDDSKSGIELARRAATKGTFVRAPIDREIRARTGLTDVDLVISTDVIEHMYRPADLLEAADRLLKPDGKLLVATPYHGYLKNVALALSGKMDSHYSALHDGGHIKFFSIKTLSVLVLRHSFTNLRFEFYGRGPWLWKNMICLAQKKS